MTPMLEDIDILCGNSSAEDNKRFLRFDCCEEFSTVSLLKQEYMFMPQKVKHCYLVYLLRANEGKSMIVFTSTCRSAAVMALMMQQLEISAVALHSQLSQANRLQSIAKFKSSQVNILIATDVASRGLDIPQVELVVNYDIPADPKDYVHRVGRTARAGKMGTAVTMVTQYDIERLQRIEDAIGKKLTEYDAPEKTILSHLNESSTAQKIALVSLSEGDFDAKLQRRRKSKGLDSEPKYKKRKNKD